MILRQPKKPTSISMSFVLKSKQVIKKVAKTSYLPTDSFDKLLMQLQDIFKEISEKVIHEQTAIFDLTNCMSQLVQCGLSSNQSPYQVL